MLAFFITLSVPVIPFLVRRSYKNEKLSGGEAAIRYLLYLLLSGALTVVFMVGLCDAGTSFLKKVDEIPVFALKYLIVQVFSALIVSGGEWWYETRRLEISVDISGFQKYPPVRFIRRAAPLGIYLLAAAAVLLNVSLIFDNVLWGDEAYSANLIRHTVPEIVQIDALEEPHPPLYYLWLKMWACLLGYSGPVFHLASVLIFVLGVIAALTVFRKRCGKLPAALFVVFTGMSQMCLTYNVEIRMYALAFLGVAFCYYEAGRLLERNKPIHWVCMVFWGLIAAYSHYFALMAAVFTMVLTCLLSIWRFGRKNWVRSVVAGVLFIAGYVPWLQCPFRAMNRIKGEWWLTASAPLHRVAAMMFGGDRFEKIVLPLIALFLFVIFLAESEVFAKERTEDKTVLYVRPPKMDKCSPECLALLAGAGAIVLTVGTAYLMDIVYRPILTDRYVYPLGGIAAIMLVTGSSRLLKLLKERGTAWKRAWLEKAGKVVLLLALALMVFAGIKDYRMLSAQMKSESEKTERALAIIGPPVENMVLVNNGVRHIGWTVLAYYYPEAHVRNNTYDNVDADDFWYFTGGFLTEEDLDVLRERGYELGGYGEQQISQYPFVLYHFFREQK